MAKPTGLLIPFGLRTADQRMIDVSEAGRGKDSGCVCPACGANLTTRKGPKNTHHFAHAAACARSLETAIHQAAKQIITELTFVWLPESAVGPAAKFYWDKLEVEKTISDIRPDALATSAGGRPLAIEFYVTHEVDFTKRVRVATHRLSTLEFDLSGLSREIGYDELKEMFASGRVASRWIYNRRVAVHELEQRKAARLREEQERAREAAEKEALRLEAKAVATIARKTKFGRTVYHVDPCPLAVKHGSSEHRYANAETECQHCRYCFGRSKRGTEITRVMCAGHVLLRLDTSEWCKLWRLAP